MTGGQQEQEGDSFQGAGGWDEISYSGSTSERDRDWFDERSKVTDFDESDDEDTDDKQEYMKREIENYKTEPLLEKACDPLD